MRSDGRVGVYENRVNHAGLLDTGLAACLLLFPALGPPSERGS